MVSQISVANHRSGERSPMGVSLDCCGQGKTDTELSNSRQHFVVPRADKAQI
jgi:hypothetical protein